MTRTANSIGAEFEVPGDLDLMPGYPADDDPSSVDEVYHGILSRIIRGELPEGAILTSTRLAAKLGVSRTPIAAAIDRLAADGIVEKEKSKRAVVRKGAGQWVVQVHRLREIVEPPAASLACKHMPDDVLQQLELMAEAAEPRRAENWMSLGREFDHTLHLSIANHCENLPLRNTIHKCWSYKRLAYEAGHMLPRNVDMGYREHMAILEALLRRDAHTAFAAMLYHLRSSANLNAQSADTIWRPS